MKKIISFVVLSFVTIYCYPFGYHHFHSFHHNSYHHNSPGYHSYSHGHNNYSKPRTYYYHMPILFHALGTNHIGRYHHYHVGNQRDTIFCMNQNHDEPKEISYHEDIKSESKREIGAGVFKVIFFGLLAILGLLLLWFGFLIFKSI